MPKQLANKQPSTAARAAAEASVHTLSSAREGAACLTRPGCCWSLSLRALLAQAACAAACAERDQQSTQLAELLDQQRLDFERISALSEQLEELQQSAEDATGWVADLMPHLSLCVLLAGLLVS